MISDYCGRNCVGRYASLAGFSKKTGDSRKGCLADLSIIAELRLTGTVMEPKALFDDISTAILSFRRAGSGPVRCACDAAA
jgi:hypothetical protein